MRVLICASTFPLRDGDGTPRFVEDLCVALAEHCEVTALVPDAPGAAARERRGAVEIRRFRYFAPRRLERLAYGAGMPDNLRASAWAKLEVAPYLAAQALAARRLARALRADVVNAHWIVPTGVATAWARGRAPERFRHVVTLHGGDAHLLRRLPARLGGACARYTAERTDAIVAASSSVKANLDAALGRDSGARVQPMGVDVARFREGAPAVSRFPDGFVLFVGRLVRIKGAHVLLHAFARVRARHPGVGLVVIGDGPQRSRLRDDALALGIATAVDFRGAQPHAEVAAALRGCRVAVVPSIVDADAREEGMPAVVAEALAAGARVVATRSGGIPDVIEPGRNGWLAAPGDPEDLAAQIEAALSLPRPAPIDDAARRTADALDWRRVARVYRDVFRGVAGG